MKTIINNGLRFISRHQNISLVLFCVLLFFGLDFQVNAQDQENNIKHGQNQENDNKLIDEYFQSKGYSGIIVFDETNIKQFWIDKAVVSRKTEVNVLLSPVANNSFESVPHRIQLANTTEKQDCKIEVVSNNDDISFTILNGKMVDIATSSFEEDFVNYHIHQAMFHLEDTLDFSFYVKFASKSHDNISFNKIILSFSENKEPHFIGSPGYDILSKEIDEKGIAVPDKDVKYIIKEEYNVIFIRIPDELASSNFLYHIFPIDKKDLMPDREKYGFNNSDFSTKELHTIVPKPFSSSNKPYIIVQKQLPTYSASIEIGQFEGSKRLWTLIFRIPQQQ